MNFCHNCGKQLPPKANVCPQCGAMVKKEPTPTQSPYANVPRAMPATPGAAPMQNQRPPIPAATPAFNAPAQAPVVVQKKSNTVLIVLLIVIISLILIGGGIFTYLYFGAKETVKTVYESASEETTEEVYTAPQRELSPYDKAFEKIKNGEYLSDSDLYYLSKDELRKLRNLPFALYGRYFKSQDLQAYFDQFDWYVPYRHDVSLNEMSAAERSNISLIQKYE